MECLGTLVHFFGEYRQMQTLSQERVMVTLSGEFLTEVNSKLAFVHNTKYKLFFNNRAEFNKCIKLSLFVFSSFRAFVIFLNLGTLGTLVTLVTLVHFRSDALRKRF
jgi:hypothetical protein